MPKAMTPQKLMITYVRCMMFGDMLNMLLLHVNDHNQDKEHANNTNGMDGPLVQVQMIEEQPMTNEVKKVRNVCMNYV